MGGEEKMSKRMDHRDRRNMKGIEQENVQKLIEEENLQKIIEEEKENLQKIIKEEKTTPNPKSGICAVVNSFRKKRNCLNATTDSEEGEKGLAARITEMRSSERRSIGERQTNSEEKVDEDETEQDQDKYRKEAK